jgi:hypothetical protein
MLETSPGDLELRDGKVGVKGAPGLEKTIAEVAVSVGSSGIESRNK